MITSAAAPLALGNAFATCPLGIGCLDREIIPPFLIDFLENDGDDITDLYCVGYLVDAIWGDF